MRKIKLALGAILFVALLIGTLLSVWYLKQKPILISEELPSQAIVASCKLFTKIGVHPPVPKCWKREPCHCIGGYSFQWKSESDLEFEANISLTRSKAKSGQIKEQLELGKYYSSGVMLQPKYEEAFEWWSMAAHQGSAEGQFRLGMLYDPSMLVAAPIAKNQSLAVEWYLKAGNQGHTQAQQRLGHFYNAQKNYEEAYFWYSLGHHAELLRELARDDLSPDQIARIKERVKQWQPTYSTSPDSDIDPVVLWQAKNGDVKAQKELGRHYGGRNHTEAKKWYAAAAEQGDAEAQFILGNNYNSERNYTQAIKWFQKAAEQGHREAMWQLHAIYRGNNTYGAKDVPVNYEEAYYWLLLAGEMNGRGPMSDWHNGIEKNLTAEQIAAVKKRVSEWKP